MKMLFVLLLFASALLFICDSREYFVKLPNGSLLPIDKDADNHISYAPGTNVCVKKYIGRPGNWIICTDGEMMDTTIITSFADSTMIIVQHKTGKINSYQ